MPYLSKLSTIKSGCCWDEIVYFIVRGGARRGVIWAAREDNTFFEYISHHQRQYIYKYNLFFIDWRNAIVMQHLCLNNYDACAQKRKTYVRPARTYLLYAHTKLRYLCERVTLHLWENIFSFSLFPCIYHMKPFRFFFLFVINL